MVMWIHHSGIIQQPKYVKAAEHIRNSWLNYNGWKAWFLHEAYLTNNMKTIWWETGRKHSRIYKLNWEHWPRAMLMMFCFWCTAKQPWPLQWLFSYLTMYQWLLSWRGALPYMQRFPVNASQHSGPLTWKALLICCSGGICLQWF